MASDLVLAQGLKRTRATFELWRAERWRVLVPWFAGSAGVAVVLLVATWVLATQLTPDAVSLNGGEIFPSTMTPILQRNALVLALHAMACVAGFIAGSSLPLEAERYGGIWRAVHDHAGRLAMLFVAAATLFSLTTQAYFLGFTASTYAAEFNTTPLLLLVATLPHALLELTALFLPLAAWLLASRNEDWDHLLAATFVTVAIAVPMLLIAAWIEVHVSPHLVEAMFAQ